MTHDNGFAPHVDQDSRFLTLATCKPRIRRHAQKGDWVLGFAGKTRLRGSETGRVVYLAQVSRAPLTFDHYFQSPEFKGRLDNIYYRDGQGHQQVPNGFHGPEDKEHDTSADAVLVCESFVYFGGKGPALGDAGFGDLVFLGQGHAWWEITTDSMPDRFLTHVKSEWGPWRRWHQPSELGPSPCDESCGADGIGARGTG